MDHPQKKLTQRITASYLLIPIILGLLVIISFHFYYAPSITAQMSKNNSIQDQITALSTKIINPDELKSDEDKVKAAINALLKVKYQQYIAIDIFKLMTTLTPKNIYLLTMLNKDGNVTLIGQTYSKKAVTDFLNKLTAVKFITAPKLGEITTNKDTNLNSFKIQFSINQPLEFYNVPKDNKK